MASTRHQVVLRFNNAPTKGYEENVGSKTTFKLLNRKIIDILIEAKEGTDPSSKRRRGAPKRVMNLLWRAESYHQYSQLRKLYPDEFVYLITPEFLLPTMTFYKTLVQRTEKMGIKLPEQPAAPHGFIGVAFLRQICVPASQVAVQRYGPCTAATRRRSTCRRGSPRLPESRCCAPGVASRPPP